VVAYGVLLVVCVIYFPRGLLGGVAALAGRGLRIIGQGRAG